MGALVVFLGCLGTDSRWVLIDGVRSRQFCVYDLSYVHICYILSLTTWLVIVISFVEFAFKLICNRLNVNNYTGGIERGYFGADWGLIRWSGIISRVIVLPVRPWRFEKVSLEIFCTQQFLSSGELRDFSSDLDHSTRRIWNRRKVKSDF